MALELQRNQQQRKNVEHQQRNVGPPEAQFRFCQKRAQLACAWSTSLSVGASSDKTVAIVLQGGEVYLGGEIQVVNRPDTVAFPAIIGTQPRLGLFSVNVVGVPSWDFKLGIRSTQVTGQVGTAKTAPGGPETQVNLSGTKVREMFGKGELPPPEFCRPEVAEMLIASMKQK